MANIGIFYGSTGGVTASVAREIADELKKKGFSADVMSVGDISSGAFDSYDNLILGTSTWGMGDLQDDWESMIDQLSDVEFKGKKVALFGTGDQDAYPDTFVDGLGTLFAAVVDADIVGEWSTDGYDFSDSKGVVDGKFVGLVIDEDNQSSESSARIKQWVGQLAAAF